MTFILPDGREQNQPDEVSAMPDQDQTITKPSRPRRKRSWKRKSGANRKKVASAESTLQERAEPATGEEVTREANEKPKPSGRRSRPGYRRPLPAAASEEAQPASAESHEQALARSLNRLSNNASPRALRFPGLNTTLAKHEILEAIKTVFEESGLESIHLALSGGLDSAVTAGLTAEAVGRKHLRLIHFLEAERPVVEKSRAELIAKYLGISLVVHDCRQLVQNHMNNLKTSSSAVRHRLLCRERMTALVTAAEHEHGLVISGINKTKWMLGLTVPYGDMAGVLNPIGDLYHSQLLELAKAINVPKVILDYAQKATVVPKQHAGEALNLTWKEADLYLYQMVDAKWSLAYLMNLGTEEEKVKALYQQLRASALQRQGLIITDLSKAYQER